MRIPPFLDTVLARDRKLHSAVLQCLDFFSDWFKSSGLPLFPEYTDHGPTHIEEVLTSATAIIRDEAREIVTPSDAAVLIAAALLHDSAMHLSEDGFLELLNRNDERLEVIQKEFEDKPWDVLWEDYLAKAKRFDAKILVDLFGSAEAVRRPNSDPAKWSRNDRLLIGDFVRRYHHRIAHETAMSGTFGAKGCRVNLLFSRDLADLAGLVARSHGMPLRSCLSYLDSHYDRRECCDVHAVFLMVLLRISDYLQIHSDRARGDILMVRALRSPMSLGEWRLHEAVRDIRQTHEDPEVIYVDVRPKDLRTYLRLKDLISGLQAELDSSWAVLGEIYGRWKDLNPLGITLRRVRSSIDDEDHFARLVTFIPRRAAFDASSGDLIPLLIGPLYGNAPDVGIRELIQNAVDAVRERIEIEKQLGRAAHECLELLEADVVLSVDGLEGGDAWLTISDQGIGMTVDTICSYFLKVGASFRRSESWRAQFEEAGRSKVLRSGRFGVGVLAAFLLGDEIEVSTRHADESSHGLTSVRLEVE